MERKARSRARISCDEVLRGLVGATADSAFLGEPSGRIKTTTLTSIISGGDTPPEFTAYRL